MQEIRGKNITEESTTKQTYRAIKDIMNPEFMVKNLMKIEEDGKVFENPKELSELFNWYFPDKISNLAKKLKNHQV